MKTKNAMQLKAKLKQIAVEKELSPQLTLQNYMLERMLARIAESNYRENFIIKGGFLIGSIVGIDSRTTMDLDTTISGFNLTKDKLSKIFDSICTIEMDDDIEFRIEYITEIRESDEYPGLRVALKAEYEKMSVPITIDVTTADVITPTAVVSQIPTMFGEGYIRVHSYNLETILAEKIETILSRAETNTRPRDFYDVYILYRFKKDCCNYELLRLALKRTSIKRGSVFILENAETILHRIYMSDSLKKYWYKYSRTNKYAEGLSYEDTCDALKEILTKILK